MAWESRKGRGSYYTRSLWRDGRVVREYVGCGQKGEKAARRDVQERATLERLRQQAARIEREEQARLRAIERPLDELSAVCAMLMETALERAGYHKPKRWLWRRRRESKKH